MRTEEDIRSALASLERHAPAVSRVLPHTTPGIPNGWWRLAFVRRHWRGAGLTVAGAAAAAGLAVAVAAGSLPGTAPAHSGPVHPGEAAVGAGTGSGASGHAALRARLLAALSAANDEIFYERSTSTYSSGTAPYATESWFYPGHVETGQPVRSRRLTLNPDGTPYQDIEDMYRMPAPGSIPSGLPPALERRLHADHAGQRKGAIFAIGETVDVEYSTRTWSDRQDQLLVDVDPATPTVIPDQVASKPWKVTGRATVDGHQAIELTWSDGDGGTSRLWVDASTYLPLREESSYQQTDSSGKTTQATVTTRDDYELLPATAANLAKLRPPVPAGFRRTATQVLPAENGHG